MPVNFSQLENTKSSITFMLQWNATFFSQKLLNAIVRSLLCFFPIITLTALYNPSRFRIQYKGGCFHQAAGWKAKPWAAA